MEWKKILKAALIPVAVWFLLQVILNLILRLAYIFLTTDQYSNLSAGGFLIIFKLLFVLLSVIIAFIIVGYSSIRGYSLRFIDAVIVGILAVFFLIIAEAVVVIAFSCIISDVFIIRGGHGHLTMCENTWDLLSGLFSVGIYYSMFGIFGLIIGWVGALIIQRVKPRDFKKVFEKSKNRAVITVEFQLPV